MSSHTGQSKSQNDLLDKKPEAGLAEWTSKIKAMQRQVDADEEAEQRTLEEEIAASRLARLRRSHGVGYSSRTNSLDVSKFKDDDGRGSQSEFDATTIDTTKPAVERQSNQAEALQKLTGDIALPSSGRPPVLEGKSSATSSVGSKPISLAAFMGGRGTGPRLKKHAPQQDAHDPTQFQQRNFDRIPHPTFGTGGVAMPGMTSQKNGGTSTNYSQPSSRHSELPPITKPPSETCQGKAALPRSTDIRERTTSTPAYASSSSWTTARQTKPVSPVPTSPYSSSTTTTPGKINPDRGVFTRSISAATSIDQPITSSQPDNFSPPSKSPIVTPSLARPIRPEPRPSSGGPQIPTSQIPSKAFLRLPAQKELTPSISRLQGRGFVQNMVKVSTQLESPPASVGDTPEKNRSGSGRRTSVLDRWQPNLSPNPSSPPPSPTPRSVRRSATVNPMAEKSQPPKVANFGKSLREATSFPSLRQGDPRTPNFIPEKRQPENMPPVGLGSATTLMVFKPTPLAVQKPSVDELGFQHKVVPRGGLETAAELPTPSRNPLSHPTRERAQKPRKAKSGGTNGQPSSMAHTVSQEPSKPIVHDPPSVVQNETFARYLNTPPQSEIREENIATNYPLTEPVTPIKDTERTAIPLPSMLPSGRPADNPGFKDSLVAVVASIPNPSIRRVLPGMVPSSASNGVSKIESKSPQVTPTVEKTSHGSIRRALPGMVASELTSDKGKQSKPTPPPDRSDKSPPSTTHYTNSIEQPNATQMPARPPRIPSTGNRATVMDVAQALVGSEGPADTDEPLPIPESPKPPTTSHPRVLAPAHNEKRKSSYEKYSSIILPPLKEETTPAPSPATTLTRKEGSLNQERLGSKIHQPFPDVTSPSPQTASAKQSASRTLHDQNILPPGFNIDVLLEYDKQSKALLAESTTISVDVMTITGTTASPISQTRMIFYDTEILAIVHRSKSRSSGLVSNVVWGWEGKRATLGEREQRKLQELAKRYGTSANIVHQNLEPAELVTILGGTLAIRQGTRTHWSPENTAMHLVRSQGGVIFVDEKDLSIKNLCSAFSYCVCILGSVYIWYGRGSTPRERQAALQYGQALTGSAPPIELFENGGDDDEMFWMILGDEEFANADYWKWRPSSSVTNPRIWRINSNLGKDCVTRVDYIAQETSLHSSVYIMDCVWELYVVVGTDARGFREDIRLALHLASELSTRVSPTRPYSPTVHALILPSQLPRDLRLSFRDLDEFSMNNGDIPDHMNILPSSDAFYHLQKSSWDRSALQDQTMLPLGVDLSNLQ